MEHSVTNNTILSKHKLFKTRLCKHFARGLCLYGDFCSFSHGEKPEEIAHLRGLNEQPTEVKTPFFQRFADAEESRRSLIDDFSSYRSRSLSAEDIEKIFEGW